MTMDNIKRKQNLAEINTSKKYSKKFLFDMIPHYLEKNIDIYES
jgi:hypothetical protein